MYQAKEMLQKTFKNIKSEYGGIKKELLKVKEHLNITNEQNIILRKKKIKSLQGSVIVLQKKGQVVMNINKQFDDMVAELYYALFSEKTVNKTLDGKINRLNEQIQKLKLEKNDLLINGEAVFGLMDNVNNEDNDRLRYELQKTMQQNELLQNKLDKRDADNLVLKQNLESSINRYDIVEKG
eukprot:193824_1